jgi:cytoplasmic tRNA 2-thiolation protein 1
MGGCGSANGQTSGNEMAQVEASLKRQAKSNNLETEITSNGIPKIEEEAVALPIRKRAQKESLSTPMQTLGQCIKCGYMSSQAMCQACTLLETLNKNRAEISI